MPDRCFELDTTSLYPLINFLRCNIKVDIWMGRTLLKLRSLPRRFLTAFPGLARLKQLQGFEKHENDLPISHLYASYASELT